MDILNQIATAFLQYGAIGLLAAVGWVLSGWFLYRDSKRKEEQEGMFKEKDDLLEAKDKALLEAQDKHTNAITTLSEKRIDDFKEITKDFNTLSNMTVQTLEKLTIALEIKPRR